jgi:hypothetical protein
MASNRSFRRIEHDLSPKAQVSETYCPACWHLNGPYLELSEVVEKVHVCPQSRAFAYPDSKRTVNS